MTTTRQSLNAASFLLTPEKRAELEKKVEGTETPITEELILTDEQKKAVEVIKNQEQSSSDNGKEKEEVETEEDLFEIETPLKGKKVYGKKKEEKPEIEVSENDSYYKYLLMDLGEDKDPTTLAKVIKEAKEKANLYEEAEKKAQTYEDFFANLPSDLRAIHTAYISNQDYKGLFREFSDIKLDYNKEVTFYKDEDLVEAYKDRMPKAVKNNDWEDLDEAVQESAIILARQFFEKEKSEVELKSQKIKQDNDLFLERYNQSIDSSLNSYQQVSNLDSNKKAKLKKIMQGDLLSAFFNKDGTYQADAAEKLAYALYGKETLETYEQKLNEAIERNKRVSLSQAREEVIKTSDSTVKPQGGNNEQNQLQAEKQKSLTSFIRKTAQKTF